VRRKRRFGSKWRVSSRESDSRDLVCIMTMIHTKRLQRAKDMADGEPFGKKKESYLGVGGWVAKSR